MLVSFRAGHFFLSLSPDEALMLVEDIEAMEKRQAIFNVTWDLAEQIGKLWEYTEPDEEEEDG
jgi:hypothetical protein